VDTDRERTLTEQTAQPGGPVSGPLGADAGVVGRYVARVQSEPAWLDSRVEVISGGRSNLTYAVTSSAGELVLRRPPLRAVRPTAHDMVREYRVLTALAGTAVPVPATVHLCTDPDVLGAPFYLMERVSGVIARGSLPPGYAEEPAERAAVAHGLLDVLADLHAVSPAEVGLADFGRPDGYRERQLRRWVGEWEALRDQERPDLDRLAADLATAVPDGASGSIVHGDYRLDNVVLHPERPGEVRAVLDWEMSTLGDPLADLGLLLVYWRQGKDDRLGGTAIPSVTALPGFPSRRQVADRYAERTGRDISPLPWYVAFGFFKLAVVVVGILARQRAGAMTGDVASGVAATIDGLVAGGRRALDTADLE
jgi:aminoglycoside phosphotransferase (APT) family kinase protein